MAAQLLQQQPQKSNLQKHKVIEESSTQSFGTSDELSATTTLDNHHHHQGDETAPMKTTTMKTTKPRTPKVSFHGVAVRVFSRALGDNPAAEHGPPLSLGWKYVDLTRETSTSTTTSMTASTSTASTSATSDSEQTEPSYTGSDNDNNNDDDPIDPYSHHDNENDNDNGCCLVLPPSTVFPIDEYEAETSRRRRTKLLEVLGLREQSREQFEAMERTVERRISSGDVFFVRADENDNKDHPETLSEEEMNQLSAKWLKIQPVSGRRREKILLQQTDSTKAEIDQRRKELFKLRSQRKSTIAMTETGLDDWQVVAETLKRRFRRFKSGISKQREQDLLWEKAHEYFRSKGSSMSSNSSTEQEMPGAERKDQAPPKPVVSTAA